MPIYNLRSVASHDARIVNLDGNEMTVEDAMQSVIATSKEQNVQRSRQNKFIALVLREIMRYGIVNWSQFKDAKAKANRSLAENLVSPKVYRITLTWLVESELVLKFKPNGKHYSYGVSETGARYAEFILGREAMINKPFKDEKAGRIYETRKIYDPSPASESELELREESPDEGGQ